MNYLLIIFFVILVDGQTTDIYEGYKVYKIVPKSKEQLLILENYVNNPKFDVWSQTRLLDIPWVIMVSPFEIKDFEYTLSWNKFDFDEINGNFGQNVQKVFMDNDSNKNDSPTVNFIKNISMNNNIRNKRGIYMKLDEYYTYETIQNYMYDVANEFPDKVSIITLGKTYEKRKMQGVKISSGPGNKSAILIDAGIHAREWITPPVALNIIKQLTNNPNYDYMIRNVDWYIFPVINPDGYEYSHRNDKLWRKTRSIGTYCNGVDANRNWDFHWGEHGQNSEYECDETYIGTTPFSEPETQLYANFVWNLKNQIKLYLSFHSYGSLILYPWAYTTDQPSNVNELHQLGSRVSLAIFDFAGTIYLVGPSPEILYQASGTSFDWMAGRAGIPLSYTIELPGLHKEFNPPSSNIQGVLDEMFVGIKIFYNHVTANYN